MLNAFPDLKQKSMKIALLQLNPTVGDLKGNAKIIAGAVRRGEGRRFGRHLRAGAAGLPAPRSAPQCRFCEAQLGCFAPARRGSRGFFPCPGGPGRAQSWRGGPSPLQLCRPAARWPRWRGPFRRRCFPPTTSSTRIATLSRPASPRFWIWEARSLASPSARISGTIATSGSAGAITPIPSRSWWRPEPRRSSTSPPRPSQPESR